MATFKGLVQLADFGQGVPAAAPSEAPGANGTHDEIQVEDDAEAPEVRVMRSQGPGVTINVNLQLTLPESTDPAVYEALFGALAKHVLQKNA